MSRILGIVVFNIILISHGSSAQTPTPSYVVETTVVKPVEKFAVYRRYIGTIQAEKFSLLTPRISGIVSSIDVKASQKVKKGQLLVSLKSSLEKRSLELLEQALRSLEKEVLRNRALFKSQDITKSQLEKSEREVLLAKAKLEEQKKQVENVEIRAPFDGVVGVPRVVLGETVQPTDTIISIMDGPHSIVINIPASRLAEVDVGQPLKVKEATTKVSAVERSIDPKTRMGFAKAIFDKCDQCIIGDSVYANITIHEKANAILVNRNAVYYQDGKPHVVVVKKDEEKALADIKEIVIGEEQEGMVEVVSGLNAGDEIVIANPKRIPKNASLTVLK